LAHIDHTLIEVTVISSVTGEALDRLWLTLMIDAYSRVPLAHYLTFDPPSYRSVMMILRECVRRHGRLPDKIIVDRGKDFESVYFETLLAFFGISKFSRPPGQPRFGSIMERGLGAVQSSVFHSLEGNTQNLKLGRSASASHDPAKHAVWTADELDEQLSDWLYKVYPTLRHNGVLEAPQDRMQRSLNETGLRAHRFITYDESFLLMTLPEPDPSTRLVHPQKGIRLHHCSYWSPELGAERVKGTKVELRYDPFDPTYIYAHIRGKWLRCETRNHLLREFTERDIKYAAEELRQLAKLTGREYRLTPERLVSHLQQRHEKQALLRKERKALQARYHGEVPADNVETTPTSPAEDTVTSDDSLIGEDSYPVTTLDEEEYP
jgi:transposase InsO family protein